MQQTSDLDNPDESTSVNPSLLQLFSRVQNLIINNR